jgi:hypothetical protein
VQKLKNAMWNQMLKVLKAFAIWGLGILFMIGYCFFVFWMKEAFGTFVMIMASLFYLAVFYFFIDLWWGYNKNAADGG